MKVTGYGTVQYSSPTSKAGNVGSVSNFADFLAMADAQEAAHVGTVNLGATSAMNNMLVFQEVSDEDVLRKKQTQHGKNLLDMLEKLRRQLLIGTLPPQLVQEMTRQLAQRRQFMADPVLTELLDDIELRAAVEVAKLEMAVAAENLLSSME